MRIQRDHREFLAVVRGACLAVAEDDGDRLVVIPSACRPFDAEQDDDDVRAVAAIDVLRQLVSEYDETADVVEHAPRPVPQRDEESRATHEGLAVDLPVPVGPITVRGTRSELEEVARVFLDEVLNHGAADMEVVHVPNEKYPEDSRDHLKCPHCGVLDRVVEEDRSERSNGCEFSPAEQAAELRAGLLSYQADGDFQTVRFVCGSCREPVTIPDSVTVDWT